MTKFMFVHKFVLSYSYFQHIWLSLYQFHSMISCCVTGNYRASMSVSANTLIRSFTLVFKKGFCRDVQCLNQYTIPTRMAKNLRMNLLR